MKSYKEYIDEILPDELLEGLLGYGLFAEKLPPVFSSILFYEYCKQRNTNFQNKWHDYIRYETSRNINIPRLLSIPNPFAYANLCNCIVGNWENIKHVFEEATSNQKYKVSQIHIQKLKEKKQLFEMNRHYSDKDADLTAFIDTLQIKKKFKVSADISNCFPSMYSHSLPWAIVDKDVAKKDTNNKLWYNKLDTYVRNIKNGETNGLLIGPHTSNILSELILCRIDEMLVHKYYYVRNIDDFTCYVESDEKAEEFLLELNSNLKSYELTLNAKKTEIQKLPTTAATEWIIALNSFFIGESYTEERKLVFKYQRLKAYIDLATQLANKTNNYSVYSYAIKTISNTYLGRRALSYYISIIHHLVCMYPYLVHWLDEFVFETFNVAKETIKAIADDVYDIGKKRKIFEACSFSLYWALKYDFSLRHNHIEDSIKSNDCIFLLMSYLKALKENNKEAAKLFKEKAKRLVNEMDRYWLFVYEVLPKSELPEGDFRSIKKKKVTFIRSEYL